MRVKVKRLDGTSGRTYDTEGLGAGVTWGVPWKRGMLRRDEELTLLGRSGESIPVQTWHTAFWPDGSVKWTAHAARFAGNIEEYYYIDKAAGGGTAEAGVAADLAAGSKPSGGEVLVFSQSEDSITVDTGKMTCIIGRSGASVIREIRAAGRRLCCGSALVCILEERSGAAGVRTFRETDCGGEIHNAVTEQEGPVRGVVRIEGKHAAPDGSRQLMPFTLRMYFYTGLDSIRFVYTSFYDGNPHMDFIKGLGIKLMLPLAGELYNRHIRLGGDTGLFCDSPKNLDVWRREDKYAALQRQQMDGKAIRLDLSEDADFLDLLGESALWNDFKIVQASSDVYSIYKRTGEGCSWLPAGQGSRASGLAYAGGAGGGLAVAMKYFWQKYPSSLEIGGMASDVGQVALWFWSPDCGAMDLRHYDVQTHVMSGYEGFRELRSTPFGIANTSEFLLKCFSGIPRNECLIAFGEQVRSAPMLVCEPEYYHSTKVFGVWSLPDKSTAAKARLEKELEDGCSFFMDQLEQWKWYGYWNYGDIMRAYDPVRHTWRYDVGGFAWNNNEFDPNIWLWYMFLRTGREDIFRMAEAFTRHAGEVDQYHFGEYAPLGSRHNVSHWGCGCKEARISMAALHRFYYFLTGDERVGDIIDEVKDADYATVNLDPMRAYFAKDGFVTHTRLAPDWAAFVSNWMTRWERFEDRAYLNKIMKGIECIGKLPHRLCSGPVCGYDPGTGELVYIGDNNYSFHMMNCFGAPVVWMELSELLENEKWIGMLADYGRFYMAEDAEKLEMRPDMAGSDCKSWGSGDTALSFAAFSAMVDEDRELAKKVWDRLLHGGPGGRVTGRDDPGGTRTIRDAACHRTVEELPWANSGMALRYLFIIQCLELIGRWMP